MPTGAINPSLESGALGGARIPAEGRAQNAGSSPSTNRYDGALRRLAQTEEAKRERQRGERAARQAEHDEQKKAEAAERAAREQPAQRGGEADDHREHDADADQEGLPARHPRRRRERWPAGQRRRR